MSMTRQQLDELKTLADAAMPGPWRGCEHEAMSPDVFLPGGDRLLMAFWPQHKVEETRRVEVEMYATIDFIAAAREAVPALIAEVTRLRVPLYNGCLTGDCPHDKQADCDKALAYELRRIHEETRW